MLALACDHGGYNLMRAVIRHLSGRGVAFTFFGTYSTESCDYTDFAEPACRAVTSGDCDGAILICGTGIGMSIAANKIHGIRAAVCGDLFSAEMTRRHNNANVLCLGARVLEEELAVKIVDTFLDTGFDGERHAVRIGKIHDLELRG